MENPMVYAVASKCFTDMDEVDYEALTERGAWDAFIDAVRMDAACCPLFEFLSQREADALVNPPSFAEHRQFCRRHFTGGLPQSAMPVESLYRPGDARASAAGSYGGASARYMEALIERLGLSVPASFSAWPDHLALELDVLAVLYRSGAACEARMFLTERFDWLTDYRQRLLRLDDSAADFYIALVDVIIDRVACASSHGLRDGAAVPDGDA